MLALRQDLVTALTTCIRTPFRARARRFLLGLSMDEMQFIAEFLGSCMIDSAAGGQCSRAQMAQRIARFCAERPASRRPRRADDDHKIILLLEYLGRVGVHCVSDTPPMQAGWVN
jgi:hypothetical protein